MRRTSKSTTARGGGFILFALEGAPPLASPLPHRSSIMIYKISPWADSVELISANGELTATIVDTREIAMGSPTSGSLTISNGMIFQRCNPSIVWSDDSQFLAVPQWTFLRDQRLLVIAPKENRFGYAKGIFRVLELHSFSDGKIKGIDSPIYQPCEIEMDINEIQWS